MDVYQDWFAQDSLQAVEPPGILIDQPSSTIIAIRSPGPVRSWQPVGVFDGRSGKSIIGADFNFTLSRFRSFSDRSYREPCLAYFFELGSGSPGIVKPRSR